MRGYWYTVKMLRACRLHVACKGPVSARHCGEGAVSDGQLPPCCIYMKPVVWGPSSKRASSMLCRM